MAELKEQIEKERVKLRVDKNMVLVERNKAQAELEKKEEELKKAQWVIICSCHVIVT